MSSPYQIQIANTQSAVHITDEELMHVAAMTLQSEGVTRAEISVALVDDPTIHQVNRDYLQHDYPTDVISFLLEGGEGGPPSTSNTPPLGRRGGGKWLNGEVILSGDTAVREASEYGWEPRAEVILYLVHGLLHICGYDDLSDDEQNVMRSREREILRSLGLEPKYAED